MATLAHFLVTVKVATKERPDLDAAAWECMNVPVESTGRAVMLASDLAKRAVELLVKHGDRTGNTRHAA